MEKFLDSLESADRTLRTADHMTYITFPLIKDKRLLIKILSEIYSSVLNIINAILQYEYFYKRIVLYQDAGMNFKTFRERCAARFGISQENIGKVVNLFEVIEKHKQSPLEFVRKDKFVIMSDNAHTDTVTTENLKEFLILAKDMLKKANSVIQKGG